MKKKIVICLPSGLNETTIIHYLTEVLPTVRHVKFYTNNPFENPSYYNIVPNMDLMDMIVQDRTSAVLQNYGFAYVLLDKDMQFCYEQEYTPLVVTNVAPYHVAGKTGALMIGLSPKSKGVLRDYLALKSFKNLNDAISTQIMAKIMYKRCKTEFDYQVEYDLGYENKHCLELERIILKYIIPKVG